MTCKCDTSTIAKPFVWQDWYPTDPVYPEPSVPQTHYMQTYPSQDWVDLLCGCKMQMPVWYASGIWTATTTITSSEEQLELPFEEEEDPWDYYMSCPCGDYDLYYNKTSMVWGFMKDDDNG